MNNHAQRVWIYNCLGTLILRNLCRLRPHSQHKILASVPSQVMARLYKHNSNCCVYAICYLCKYVFIFVLPLPHLQCNGQSAVDCGFQPRSGKTKDYKIYICYFSVKHATLRSKSNDWLAQNQDNVLECSTCGLVSDSQHYKNPTEHVGLLQSRHHYHLVECNLFSS